MTSVRCPSSMFGPGRTRSPTRGLFSPDFPEGWTRLSCHDFADNQVRLQLFAPAYNLGNFLRRLALSRSVERWSMTPLLVKLIKIGAKVVSHARYTTFQMAEVAIPWQRFRTVLGWIRRLAPPELAPG